MQCTLKAWLQNCSIDKNSCILAESRMFTIRYSWNQCKLCIHIRMIIARWTLTLTKTQIVLWLVTVLDAYWILMTDDSTKLSMYWFCNCLAFLGAKNDNAIFVYKYYQRNKSEWCLIGYLYTGHIHRSAQPPRNVIIHDINLKIIIMCSTHFICTNSTAFVLVRKKTIMYPELGLRLVTWNVTIEEQVIFLFISLF